MRLGRTAFWGFALLDVIAAVLLTGLLPENMRTLTGPVTLLVCLPIGWTGMLRLADTSRNVWQSWIPLLPLAVWAVIPYAQNLLRAFIISGQAQGYITPLAAYARAIVIGLWLSGLLLAAGVLRTCFLWLEPGKTDAGRVDPALDKPPAFDELTIPLLEGRLGRLPYWMLVAINFALVSGLRYVIVLLMPSLKLNMVSAFLFIPAFAATVMRLHDRGRPGTLAIAVFLISAAAPVAELFLGKSQINLLNIAVDLPTFYLLFQCLQPGDPEPNRYDKPDKNPRPDPVMPAPRRPASSPIASRTTNSAGPRNFGRRSP